MEGAPPLGSDRLSTGLSCARVTSRRSTHTSSLWLSLSESSLSELVVRSESSARPESLHVWRGVLLITGGESPFSQSLADESR